MKNSQKISALGRGLSLGKLGFSLVGSYLGYQAQNLLLGEQTLPQRRARFQQEASGRVRKNLGSLKGPAMKLGQLLSLQQGVLTEESLQELSQLQMQAPGMHASLARAQFKAALGKYPEDVFRKFEPDHFAAASLGQVHRAITHSGEKVAVKIQYPAIRSAIESDFKLLRTATLPTQLTGHVPMALLDEIQRGLVEETDYLREADNMEFFRKGLSGLAYVTVPRVYRELSSDRVLTMSFVAGMPLSDWLKLKPAQALRDLVGLRLAEIYETQLQHLKALHADQHPGNYLFSSDGGIGLIDFGCVKRFSFDIVELRRCYRERVWRESEAAARRFLAMVYSPRAPYERARKALPFLEQWMDIIRPPGTAQDVIIDFRHGAGPQESRLQEIRQQLRKLVFRDKLIDPASAFIMRADMGMRHLLSTLGVRINISELERRVAANVSASNPSHK